jgi:hypothetical protein
MKTKQYISIISININTTGLKSQAPDWLKWQLIATSANQMLEISDWSPNSGL